MGVRKDIRWLKEDDDRVDLFVLIAKQGPMKARKLKNFLQADDWWPTKYHIDGLEENGLIEEDQEGYRLTTSGEKVFESLKTVYDIESV